MPASAACPLLAVWAAPGEDPVTISGRVTYLQLPTSPLARSGNLEYRKDMPDDMAAKVSRYTAKAYTPNTGDIKTEKMWCKACKPTAPRPRATNRLAAYLQPAVKV